MKVTRRRRQIALRTLALSACAAGVLALTACSSGSSDAGPAATAATAPPAKAGDGTETTAPATAVPAGKVSTPPASKATPPPASATSPSGSPIAAGTGGEDDGCDHKMPVSPDEIAVSRYTPEGGSLSLIFRHGNWGCGTPDSDSAPFETVGKETYLPMDQAAYITVTDPIVTSTENQHIGVQEFLDWLDAHPDSGLVFKYHLGADGAIDSLEQIFTP
ncbi:hypothetical protein [Streptomyces sp. S.PB5]|uniref:hypothetical protein n=1 Tax=Streptomyces sp. S.PB5 TaxID=3020844 RepID=UPI0025B00507|nr:hypothetical protein [Streptomyces sp. S.PB5]MDN3026140.1 hypothetical protein [Streptomyces sp. S.PB5]